MTVLMSIFHYYEFRFIYDAAVYTIYKLDISFKKNFSGNKYSFIQFRLMMI